jgi:hypothetical protein
MTPQADAFFIDLILDLYSTQQSYASSIKPCMHMHHRRRRWWRDEPKPLVRRRSPWLFFWDPSTQISFPAGRTTVGPHFLQFFLWKPERGTHLRGWFLPGLRFSDIARCYSRCHWVTDVWAPHVSDSMAPRMAPSNVTESQSFLRSMWVSHLDNSAS